MHVLIGHPPGIYRHTDRWGAQTDSFECYRPFRVAGAFWETLQRYQAPYPVPPPGVLVELQSLRPWEWTFPTASPALEAFLAVMTEQLAAFGRQPETLHQFEAWSPHHRDFVRQVAVAGEQWFRPWTRFDRWVRYPISIAWARIRSFRRPL